MAQNLLYFVGMVARRIIISCFCFILFWSVTAHSEEISYQEAKITVNDGDSFGYAIASTDDWAVFTANRDGMKGSAYIYQKNEDGEWVRFQKLTPPIHSAAFYIKFGDSVAMTSDRIIIGATGWEDPNDDDWAITGGAFIYKFDGTTWVLEQTLLPENKVEGSGFAHSVTMTDDYAFVGAPIDDNDNADYSGSVYVYKFDGASWTAEGKLIPPSGQANDQFGRSVAIENNTLVVGAPYVDKTGAAFVFEKNSEAWEFAHKISPGDGQDNDAFGFDVAIDNQAVVVGTFSGNQPGSVYVFRKNEGGWGFEQKLVASDGQMRSGFGKTVAKLGGSILIGAETSRAPDRAYQSGSAYVFKYSEGVWAEDKILTASDGGNYYYYANDVSLNADSVFVGNMSHPSTDEHSIGAVYSYNLPAGITDPESVPESEIEPPEGSEPEPGEGSEPGTEEGSGSEGGSDSDKDSDSDSSDEDDEDKFDTGPEETVEGDVKEEFGKESEVDFEEDTDLFSDNESESDIPDLPSSKASDSPGCSLNPSHANGSASLFMFLATFVVILRTRLMTVLKSK